MDLIGTVPVSGAIAPTSMFDPYATHFAQFGHGGYRSVLNIEERDKIKPLRREEGMVVYVISEKEEYRLEEGIENIHWALVPKGGGSTGGTPSPSEPTKHFYMSVSDVLTRDNIPLNLRTEGMICYVQSEEAEYRLVDGLDNSFWKIISQNGEIVNKSYYYQGCKPINADLLQSLVKDLASDNPQNVYKDSNGNIIHSKDDLQPYEFTSDQSEILGRYIYFSGSIDVQKYKNPKVKIELQLEGVDTPQVYNVLDDNINDEDIFHDVHKTTSKFNGYIKLPKGQHTLVTWEEGDNDEDGNPVKSAFINITVNIHEPTYTVEKLTNTNTNDIIEEDLGEIIKEEYRINNLGESVVKVSLVRVDVLPVVGIKTAYNIDGTTQNLDKNTDLYNLYSQTIKDLKFDGNYALCIKENNKPDNYFGPFKVKLNRTP